MNAYRWQSRRAHSCTSGSSPADTTPAPRFSCPRNRKASLPSCPGSATRNPARFVPLLSPYSFLRSIWIPCHHLIESCTAVPNGSGGFAHTAATFFGVHFFRKILPRIESCTSHVLATHTKSRFAHL